MSDIQRLFKMEASPLVKDSDMLFHSETRNEFCSQWTLGTCYKEANLVTTVIQNAPAPTIVASAYSSYLKSANHFDDLFQLTKCSGQIFKRTPLTAHEQVATSTSATSSRILTECSMVEGKKKCTRIDGCAWKKCKGCKTAKGGSVSACYSSNPRPPPQPSPHSPPPQPSRRSTPAF